MARSFNGTNQSLQSASAIDLTGTQKVALSFWLYTTFTNDDDIILEFSANSNSNAGAFKVIACDSVSGFFWVDVFGNVGKNARRLTANPSNNIWHQFTINLDFSLTGSGGEVPNIYVDGTTPGSTAGSGGTSDNTGNFGSYTLNVMSRNNASLFADGRLAELAIFKGRNLTANEATALWNGVSVLKLDPDFYWPLWGTHSDEPAMKGGVGLTLNGSPTQIDHAPVQPFWKRVASAGELSNIGLTQEGFRFYNDNGNESGATGFQPQDTNITQTRDVPMILRTLVDSTGDIAGQNFQLEWQKVGDSVWRKVDL